MYFHILFYLHIFLKNTNNVTKITLPNGTKVVMHPIHKSSNYMTHMYREYLSSQSNIIETK